MNECKAVLVILNGVSRMWTDRIGKSFQGVGMAKCLHDIMPR